jgi:putative flippase GtrA
MDDTLLEPDAEMSPSLAILGSDSVHQLIRYGFASALALAVDAALLWIGTSLVGINYLLSGALSFLAGLVVVYVLSVRWVFDHRTLADQKVEFIFFCIIGFAGLALNEIILFMLTGLLGINYMISKAVSVILVFTWNFLRRKALLFS